jgi:hypothetical protein
MHFGSSSVPTPIARMPGSASAVHVTCVLVRAVLVGLELAAQDAHLLSLEVRAEPREAPGVPLAGGAVAHRRTHGVAFHAVAHCTAKTTAFVRIGDCHQLSGDLQ